MTSAAASGRSWACCAAYCCNRRTLTAVMGGCCARSRAGGWPDAPCAGTACRPLCPRPRQRRTRKLRKALEEHPSVAASARLGGNAELAQVEIVRREFGEQARRSPHPVSQIASFRSFDRLQGGQGVSRAGAPDCVPGEPDETAQDAVAGH